jgi:hypothetical protein
MTSCDQVELDKETIEINNKLELFETSEFADKMLSHFTLISEEATLTDKSSGKVLYVPAELKKSILSLDKSMDHYIIAMFNHEDKVSGVLVLSGHDISNSTTEFSGKVELSIFDKEIDKEYESIKLNVDNGEVVSIEGMEEIRSKISYRTKECSGVYDVLYCAGEKFENAKCCFEEGACYLAFIPCLIYRGLDCLIQDCPTR